MLKEAWQEAANFALSEITTSLAELSDDVTIDIFCLSRVQGKPGYPLWQTITTLRDEYNSFLEESLIGLVEIRDKLPVFAEK